SLSRGASMMSSSSSVATGISSIDASRRTLDCQRCTKRHTNKGSSRALILARSRASPARSVKPPALEFRPAPNLHMPQLSEIRDSFDILQSYLRLDLDTPAI